jgi:hypothetical protein
MTGSRTCALTLVFAVGLAEAARADPLVQSPAANAFINLGAGPYPAQSFVATGSPQAWYDSPQVASLFGGTPTAAQQQAFDQAVMQDVQQTFQLSGISVNLTDNPNTPALHTLSVVSNATSLPFPGAIGTTLIGGSGMSFIDVEAQAAQSVNQLEWIVAHNVSHELMLAFGVGENYDKTGNYIDAESVNWSTIISANSTFSPAAAQAINASLATMDTERVVQPNAQQITLAPVPEPMTVLLWGLAGTVALARRTRKSSCRTLD